MNDYILKRWQQKIIGKPQAEQKKYILPKLSEKKKLEIAEAKKSGDSRLEQWFQYHMKNSAPVCSECGMEANWVLQPGYEAIWRACQAHILPKKKRFGFPSIAANLDNHIVLFPSWGGHLCGCHGFYDSNWYNASTMKIWPQVIEIFKTKLYPLIPENEKRFIPEQLMSEIG